MKKEKVAKEMKNGLLRILNDLDSAGREKKRDKEVGGSRRKERWGENMKKLLKNEK